jgi:hypothetical protein
MFAALCGTTFLFSLGVGIWQTVPCNISENYWQFELVIEWAQIKEKQ